MFSKEKNYLTGAELVDIKENVKIDIRSLLCSFKDGLSDRELRTQYKHLTGRELPFILLGYNTLYDLMRDMSDICYIQRHPSGSTWIYYAIYDNLTKDLGKLVCGQLDKKKALRERKRSNESYQRSQRYSYQSYNSRPFGSQQQQYQQQAYSSQSTSQNEAFSLYRQVAVPADLQQQIKLVLSFSDNFKMSKIEFETEYKIKYGFLFNWNSYGFSTMRQMLESLNHLVYIEPKSYRTSYSFSDQDDYNICLITTNKETTNTTTATTNTTTINNSNTSTINNNNQNVNSINTNGDCSNSNTKDAKKKLFTDLEEETIENLKLIIEKYSNNSGIFLSELITAYRDYTGKQLEFEKLGYTSLEQLINSKLTKFIRYEIQTPNFEPKLFMRQTTTTTTTKHQKEKKLSLNGHSNKKPETIQEIDDDDEYVDADADVDDDEDLFVEENYDDDSYENDDSKHHLINSKQTPATTTTTTTSNKRKKSTNKKLIELKEHVELALKYYENTIIEVKDFYQLFEKRNGWKLDHKEYDCATSDQLICELVQLGVFDIAFDSLRQFSIVLPNKEKKQQKKTTTSNDNSNPKSSCFSSDQVLSDDSNDSKTAESMKRANADFIQDYVLYNGGLDESEVLKKLASKRTHKIIISNVINPCNFQIQLAENVNSLNKLMDDLEVAYYGIGASHYNMPESYIQLTHLCAAIFPGDNNWHRCKINGVHLESNKVKVGFIDYGGHSYVPITDVKFLSKDFAYLPAQAVNARFANIKEPYKKDEWPKDIINYLLNKVIGRTLTAEVVGFNDGFISLDIYDQKPSTTSQVTGDAKENRIHLNSLIVKEGYGKEYDETNDVEFVDFDTWQKKMFDDKDELSEKNSKTTNRTNNKLISNDSDDNSSSDLIKNNNNNKEQNISNQPTTNNCSSTTPSSKNIELILEKALQNYNQQNNLKNKNNSMQIPTAATLVTNAVDVSSGGGSGDQIIQTHKEEVNNKSNESDAKTLALVPEKQKQTFHASNNSLQHQTSMYDKKTKSNNKNSDLYELRANSVIKTKDVYFSDESSSPNRLYKLDLISLDGTIYVHWTQIATLFGLNYKIFLNFIKQTEETETTETETGSFIKTFDYSANNEILFELIMKSLKIDLNSLNESDKVYLIEYKCLFQLADLCFTCEQAEKLKNFLRNNKCKKKPSVEVLSNCNIINSLTTTTTTNNINTINKNFKSENFTSSSDLSTSDMVNKYDLLKSIDLDETSKARVLNEELIRLKAEYLYLNTKRFNNDESIDSTLATSTGTLAGAGTAHTSRLIIDQSKDVENRIEFYSNILKKIKIKN